MMNLWSILMGDLLHIDFPAVKCHGGLEMSVSTGHVEGHRGDATQGGWDWKPPKKCQCETGEVTFEVSEFSIPGFRVRLRDSRHGPWIFTVVSYVPQMTP